MATIIARHDATRGIVPEEHPESGATPGGHRAKSVQC